MKLQAAILDWAGTTVDYGSLAPVRVLQTLFERHGLPISDQEARAHMGLLKRDHIEQTLRIPRIRDAWANRATVQQLYEEFIPLQLECLADHATLIPGAAAAIERMRARGLKIGTTTGYTRPMLDILLDKAKPQGYTPDCALCPDDVGAGRPYPWMIYENAVRMKVYPLWAIVKIGDTPSDIEEGRNAGTWTVGVVETGNALGSPDSLKAANPHFLIDSIAGIDPILDEIDHRLQN